MENSEASYRRVYAFYSESFCAPPCRLLNCFSPNINLVRDPRWGRNSETYGEDPHLTAELAKAYVTGLQGNHSRYVKVNYHHVWWPGEGGGKVSRPYIC